MVYFVGELNLNKAVKKKKALTMLMCSALPENSLPHCVPGKAQRTFNSLSKPLRNLLIRGALA